MSVLKNGLQLAALPTELTGVLTGGLLIGTIALELFQRRRRARGPITQTEDFAVKNTQVAVLCGAILVGALMTSATNVWLVRSLQQPDAAAAHRARAPAGKRLVIAMMPKAKGDP